MSIDHLSFNLFNLYPVDHNTIFVTLETGFYKGFSKLIHSDKIHYFTIL